MKKKNLWAWFPVTFGAALFCCILWGSATPAIKIAYELFGIGPDDIRLKELMARLSRGDNDDRITPIGRVIRKLRIDELPQLFCIIQGSLSIVGPRPERPEIAEQYEEKMPEFALRLQAKAGLTGLAQVYGKYNTTPYDKLLMDLQYIANPSLVEDLKIMFATVKILFMPESTEGVDEGQTTASPSIKKENELEMR